MFPLTRILVNHNILIFSALFMFKRNVEVFKHLSQKVDIREKSILRCFFDLIHILKDNL